VEQQGPFEKFLSLPYYSELELCGGEVRVSFFEVPPLASDALLTMLHKLFKLPTLLLRHPKKGSSTVTQTLTTVRGMKITPLLCYPHHYNVA
jgi:hypothetical protein